MYYQRQPKEINIALMSINKLSTFFLIQRLIGEPEHVDYERSFAWLMIQASPLFIVRLCFTSLWNNKSKRT